VGHKSVDKYEKFGSGLNYIFTKGFLSMTRVDSSWCTNLLAIYSMHLPPAAINQLQEDPRNTIFL
jgi:hypothetical protein